MSHICDTFQTSFVLDLVALSCFGLKLHIMVIMKALLSFYNIEPSIIPQSSKCEGAARLRNSCLELTFFVQYASFLSLYPRPWRVHVQ